MKKIDVVKRACECEGKEYILGYDDTGSHACYLIYGILSPKESRRLIKPGKGHEEILLIIKGSVKVTGAHTGFLKAGEAFHIIGDEECFLENTEDCETVYIISGGHSEGGH